MRKAVSAGAPQTGPRTLERSLEGYFATVRGAFGADPNLPATPATLPWNFSALTQPFALGNANLDVEKVTGFEVGYKGSLTPRIYASLDLYQNQLSNFVTDLLPGVNPAYPVYLLTDGGTNIPQTLTDLDTYEGELRAADTDAVGSQRREPRPRKISHPIQHRIRRRGHPCRRAGIGRAYRGARTTMT